MSNEKNKFTRIADEILLNVGGKENVNSYLSCMTRLRIEVKDKSKINQDILKNLDYVKGVMISGTTAQIILFENLDGIYLEFQKKIGLLETTNDVVLANKISPIDNVINFVSGVFTPLIPALLAYAVLSGIVSCIEYFGWMEATSETMQLLKVISGITMVFYPALIAFSAANYLKCNPYIVALIAFIMCSPDFSILVNKTIEAGHSYISLFGLPVRAVSYTSTVFPMLCAIFGEYVVEKYVYKYLPGVIKTALAPAITLLLSTIVCLVILAPIGSYLSDLFALAFTWVYENIPLIAGLIIGSTAALTVMFGVHMILITLAFANVAALGYDVIWPILFSNNILVGAVTIATAILMVKSTKKQEFLTAGICAVIFGITEPCLYGCVIQNKGRILAMMSAGAIMGITSMLLGTKASAAGAVGIFGIPQFLTTTPWQLLITVIVTFVCGFLFTCIFQKYYEKNNCNKK